jgi:hypothetical protein
MNQITKYSEFVKGDKLYQKRARTALPILVRQAQLRKKIYYHQLAAEIGMSNPRNLNSVLTCIGKALNLLEKTSGFNIPPIQLFVINKTTKSPGFGANYAVSKNAANLTKTQLNKIISEKYNEIIYFKNWDWVLRSLSLEIIENTPVVPVIKIAPVFSIDGKRKTV